MWWILSRMFEAVITTFCTRSVTMDSLCPGLATAWMSKCILSAMCLSILEASWRSPPYMGWRPES